MSRFVENLVGLSNGNGPAHLITDGPDGYQALCGVSRLSVRFVSSITPRRPCKACERRRVERPRQITPDLVRVGERLDEIARARVETAKALREALEPLRGFYGAQLDEFVARAHDAGFTWREIAEPLGVTRQAAQQRAVRYYQREAQ